jgi:ComF family protein
LACNYTKPILNFFMLFAIFVTSQYSLLIKRGARPQWVIYNTIITTAHFSSKAYNDFMFDRVLSLVAPFYCYGCGATGELICDWCKHDACLPIPSRCFGCKKLTDNSAVCLSCKKELPIRNIWAATEYDGMAKALVRGLKFERKVEAASIMAEFLDSYLPALPTEMIIVPVPTATSRVRSRGYDQSLVIATQLGKKRNLKVTPLLRRCGQSRQVGSDRTKRLKQLDNAFVVVRRRLSNKRNPILLIDDIATTGGTLGNAAKALRKAGYREIYGCVFAQKV